MGRSLWDSLVLPCRTVSSSSVFLKSNPYSLIIFIMFARSRLAKFSSLAVMIVMSAMAQASALPSALPAAQSAGMDSTTDANPAVPAESNSPATPGVNGFQSTGATPTKMGDIPASQPSAASQGCPAPPPSSNCARSYTITDADCTASCDAFALANSVSTYQFRSINNIPAGDGCAMSDHVTVGQQVCLGEYNLDCTSPYLHTVVSQETCSGIANNAGIPLGTLYNNNRFIDTATCSNLYPNEVLCTSPTIYNYPSS